MSVPAHFKMFIVILYMHVSLHTYTGSSASMPNSGPNPSTWNERLGKAAVSELFSSSLHKKLKNSCFFKPLVALRVSAAAVYVQARGSTP
eukprot:1159343-Pelagomonas_calceolata.AAC.5